MAILEAYYSSGVTLYAHVRNISGQIWNGSSFEAYNVANWSTYDIAMTEDPSSGYYKANVPGISESKYRIACYEQLGGSPATADATNGPVSFGTLIFDGTNEVTQTNNGIADALLDRSNGIETGYTLRQALRLILAACAAKLSGAATTTVSIRDVADSKNRIVATVDSNGNRTAVTLDAT